MDNVFVCLVLALCAMKTSGMFLNYFQATQQRKFMDEGFEYLRESPSFAYSTFMPQYQPRRYQYNQQPRPQPQPQYNAQYNEYNQQPSTQPQYNAQYNEYNQQPSTQPQYNAQYNEYNQQPSTQPQYNAQFNGGFMFTRGFLDEGMEHVRERGTYGQMRSLMSNPTLLYSSLLA